MIRLRKVLFAAALSVAVAANTGCSSRSNAAANAKAAPTSDTPAPEVAARPAHPPIPTTHDNPEEEKVRFRDAGVFVDGVPIAVMRFGEMPKALEVKWTTLDDGRKVRRYLLCDYLALLGIDVDKIKAVHVYGGRGRATRIDGDLIRQYRKKLLFSYTQGEKGKPRVNWPSDDPDFHVTERVDTIAGLAIYVNDAPPRWDADRRVLVGADGKDLDWIPTKTELRGGTRVYVDDRLAGAVKRNMLADTFLVPGQTASADDARYQLFPLLASEQIDMTKIKHIALISEDVAIATLDAAKPLQFSAPPKSSGQIVVYVPAGDPSGLTDAHVQALLLSTK